MKLRIAALLVLPGLAGAANAQLVAILDATVIDVVVGTAEPGTTVLIDGAVIRSVGTDIDVPRGAQVVDANGGYLIPGLWDMHVHLSYARSNALLTLAANGVTSVRDIGSNLAEIDVWRGRIAAGELVGPSITRAGPILNDREFNRYQLAITNAADARATVRALAKAGVDIIKVHRRTSREAYFAALDEAKILGLPLAGHIPMTVAPIEAARAGQVTIEHAETLFEGTFATALASRDRSEAIRTWRESPESGALFAAFVQNDTTFDPTLIAQQNLARWLRDGGDPHRDRYFALSALREAEHLYGELRADASAFLDRTEPVLREYAAVVAAANAAGVTIVAGTDMAVGVIHPGFSLHEELEALVTAGLTPAEALRAGTINAARLFPRQNTGVVADGATADLVLLDANPLDDIRNTQRIRAVFLRGRHLDRAALDALLEESAALARVN